MGDLQEIRYKQLILQLIKTKAVMYGENGWELNSLISACPLVIVIFT